MRRLALALALAAAFPTGVSAFTIQGAIVKGEAPVAGQVTAVNAEVVDAPEKVNADAYAHWLYKLKPANAGDAGKLLDAAAYAKLAGEA